MTYLNEHLDPKAFDDGIIKVPKGTNLYKKTKEFTKSDEIQGLSRSDGRDLNKQSDKLTDERSTISIQTKNK